MSLPLRSPSKLKEELSLYLAVSPTTISSALIREVDRMQLPLCYTSQALRGAEERYPSMEKLAFALITTARKLQLYFQAHTIVVQTEKPLRKMMNNANIARRLVLSVIELSEFDVQYRQRIAIKSQALANFVTQFTPKESEGQGVVPWMVQTGGSSNRHARGIRVVLRSQEGDPIECAVCL